MKLLAYQEKSWMWCTLNDFADEIPRPEKFAVRFKSAVTAQKFKVVFEDCVSKDISFSNNEYKCREQSDEQTIHLQEYLHQNQILGLVMFALSLIQNRVVCAWLAKLLNLNK